MPDFAPLLEAFIPSLNGTNSTSSFELPVTVLESFIPGYGLIRKIVLEVFGVDVSVLVSVIGFFFLLRTAFVYSYDWVNQLLDAYFTCYIDMDEDDDPFASLMKWLVQKNHLRRARSLRAAGRWWSAMMDSPEALFEMTEKSQGRASGSPTASGIFNYETLDSKKPLGFEPDQGSYRFWHNGRLFGLRLYVKSYQHRHEDTLRVCLSCYSFSVDPIKRLLEEVRSSDHDTGREAKTNFFRAIPGDNDWRCVATRPIRPLNTVALDTAQKLRVVRDLNSFVHPTAQKWYSSRGIPYRRGYLFSGPPGTGKTSLSLALAGVFGLSLYAVSLQDNNMSEERLTQLFDYLPDRCIVLLEDIDSAGVGAKRASTQPGTPVVIHHSRFSSSGSDDGKGKQDENKGSDNRISLAGLLNAIDGVASHEGHILIMTSNHPEKLDEALKRPGRVDLHIEFSLATKFQAREIFLRMYTDERTTAVDSKFSEKGKLQSNSAVQTVEEVCKERSELADGRTCPFMSLSELDEAADAFVNDVPEKIFSPAELQGFLLLHKVDPRRAVEQVTAWAEETLRVKGQRISDDETIGGLEVKVEDADDCVKL